MADVLKKFGRYFLLDLIAQGGMAEIYRARLASPEGGGRLLVIKRIQGGFGANNEFLQMFKSEIKVTMGFNHPNIVQLYDFGEEKNQPYIAMELIEGRNLRQMLNRFLERKHRFPVDIAAFIIEHSAQALQYAHSFKDKISGEPLQIVHRDISPQNILVSYEGNVKVIDFGIAKATTNSEHTRAGVIKGKPSYLAPEQISGERLDGRCDIFALGAVLWELLTGRKLFAGENDLAVLKMIESCHSTVRPPSESNPEVPAELDTIVLKMLAREPSKRFQTGEEVARALRKFLAGIAPDFTSADLAYVVKDLFQNEIIEDRKKIMKLNDQVEELLMTDVPDMKDDSTQAGQGVPPEESTTFVARKKPSLPKAPKESIPSEKPPMAKIEIESPKAHTIPAPRGDLRDRPQATITNSKRVDRRALPTRKASAKVPWFEIAAGIFVLAAGAGYFGPKFGVSVPVVTPLFAKWLGEGKRNLASEESPELPPSVPSEGVKEVTEAVERDPAQVQTPSVPLRIKVFPEASLGDSSLKVTLQGQELDPKNLVLEVRAGIPIELQVERAGFRKFSSEFSLHPGLVQPGKELVREVTLEPEVAFEGASKEENSGPTGLLTVRTTPSSQVQIFRDGKPWQVRSAPFEKIRAPAGDYELRMYNSTLDLEARKSVKISPDQVTHVVEELKPRTDTQLRKSK